MRCHWEKLGVLGPIYELVGRGLSDHEIASKLNLTEVTVQGCTSWLMHFLKCDTWAELVQYASPVQHGTWGLGSPQIAA
jgi:FixJ family two-component response regulator